MSDELLGIFWVEVGEYLETMNAALLQVEMLSTGDDDTFQAQVRELNRVAHSLKGAARAVGVETIETIAHYLEEVFDAALKDEIELTPDVADTIYDGLDLIQNVADGQQPDNSVLEIALTRLERVITVDADPKSDSQQMPAVKINGSGTSPSKTPTPKQTDIDQYTQTMQAMQAMRAASDVPPNDGSTIVMRPMEETVRVTVGKLDQLMAEVTELFVARMHGEELQRGIEDLRRIHNRWQREWRGVRAEYIRLVRRLQDEEEEMSSELPVIFRFLEANQRHLTEANRMLAQIAQAAAQDTMRLTTLADQLQDDIGGMRLMPFESIVGGFQRMVRDLARDTGKQIQLDIIGGYVEIDKAVLDSLKDPLMHVLRNAVDHGIETPEQREAKGKPITGRVQIDVDQRGSEIVISMIDDGKGIDADSVRRSIVKNRLMNEAEAAALSDDEVRTYIFYSGLSTSDQVTSLSGRGLGMDIVRERIEGLRGRVGVQSVVGDGTTIVLNVPVSLTRIRCVLLRIGEQTFAVPSAMVLRMDHYDDDHTFSAEGRPMLTVNERTLPLVSMSRILDITADSLDDTRPSYVALEATDRAVAFEVDELLSEVELVLKPPGPELARARFISGAALLGSGDVVIILDANDLVRRASGAALPRRVASVTAGAASPTEQRLCVLVVDDSITTRTLEKNILETAGFEVHVAIDGVEAWSMLPGIDFDVIISDVEMPNLNGLQLTAKIKTSSQFRDIPVVLLTSLAKPEQREAGLKAGADAYLVKSNFDQSELLETIQSVVVRGSS